MIQITTNQFSVYRFPINFWLAELFWIMMGRSLLIRDLELESSDNFLGWIGGVWRLKSVLLKKRLEVNLY
jgi:hypothetical protein